VSCSCVLQNLLAGITCALIAGLSTELSASRLEILMYTSISVLALNAVNLALLEFGEWGFLYPKAADEEIARRSLERLVCYGETPIRKPFIWKNTFRVRQAHFYCFDVTPAERNLFVRIANSIFPHYIKVCSIFTRNMPARGIMLAFGVEHVQRMMRST
jgi:hypothetical protein